MDKMFVRLDAILSKYHQLQQKLQEDEVISDIKLYTQLSKECAQLEKTAQKYQNYLDNIQQIKEAELLLEEDDAEVVALANEEIKDLSNQNKDLYEELKILLQNSGYEVEAISEFENLENKIKALEIKEIPDIKKDYTKLQKIINLDFCKIYASLSIEEKRTFWLQIINKIYIEHGEIKEVTFL